MKLDETSLKRLTYAKHLYGAAADGLYSTSPMVAAEALLRVHDAVEIFQLVVLDSLGASGKFEFMEFWEKAKAKTGKEPPYKDRFAQLNHMRVGFKHKAVAPNLSDLRELAAIVRPFFDEVCRDVLDLDFAKLSLAQLVEDAAVRQRLNNAEDLINSQRYEEALGEIAIAMYLALSQKYPKSPWGEQLSDLLDSSGQAPRARLPHYNLPTEASGLLRDIEQALDRLGERVHTQAQVLEMLIWKIDLQKYTKFTQFVPHVFQSGDGKFYVVGRTGIRRPFTRRDVRFCFEFVVDSALAIEQQKKELPDVFAAQRIKTIAIPTTLFKFEKESAIPCGEIPAGQELEGVYCWVPGIDTAWQVTWGGQEGLVKSTDVAQVGYD